MQGYPQPVFDLLIKGFTEGFRIHFTGTSSSRIPKNLLSAYEHPDIVQNKLNKELQENRLAGPFRSPPFAKFHVSPIGVVPKKAPGDFRLIHHLSYPRCNSVNDFIDKSERNVSYATIDDAIRIIKRLGKGCAMSKTDIKSAFRIIPVHPLDYHILGMHWEGNYYYDKALPMGCSSSCKIFETFSTSLEWIAKNKLGIPHIIHILDDFLIIEPTIRECKASLDRFLTFCSQIGVPMAPEKTVGPSQVITFAGIELDTEKLEARLPIDKVIKCRTLLTTALGHNKMTLREIQSLIGVLNFACCVVKPGRAFLRRLINTTLGIKRPHHLIRLNKDTKADIQLWLRFMDDFNGEALFSSDKWLTSVKLNLYTDASKSLGYGALLGRQWFYGEWPESWKAKNIATLELFPIVLALKMWHLKFKDQSIIFFSDNEAVVQVINRKTTKDKELLALLRELVLVCLQNNIMFRARHIAGHRNILADSLSRLQVEKFHSAAPHMVRIPEQVPKRLQPQNWFQLFTN